jgi:hypothetical protein
MPVTDHGDRPGNGAAATNPAHAAPAWFAPERKKPRRSVTGGVCVYDGGDDDDVDPEPAEMP